MSMKAAVTREAGPPSVIATVDVPVPVVKPGWVLVRIKAFGVNRSEMYTRQGLSPNVQFPRIQGIEAVGVVEDPSDSDLVRGETVAATMGEMGREFDGSYAEFALLPRSIITRVETSLPWITFAAIPETYQTAYGSLKTCLHVKPGDKLLVRGAASSVGMAALDLAHIWGVETIATTRSASKVELLKSAGASEVWLDDGELAGRQPQPDHVLELIGATTLRDSLRVVKQGGGVCFTGMLGGTWVVDRFDPWEDIPTGSFLTQFGSWVMADAELAELVGLAEQGQLRPRIHGVFSLDDMAQVHEILEAGTSVGKIVVAVDT